MSWPFRRFLKDITNKIEVINMNDEEITPSRRHALVYSGTTPLGARCIADLRSNGWWVASVDFAMNPHADVNILIFKEESPAKHESNVLSSMSSILAGRKLDFIFCASEEVTIGMMEHNFLDVGVDMWTTHVIPAMICAKLASDKLKANGVLVLVGSVPAMKGDTETIGYSVAKSAVLHLTKCLALPGSGMPGDSRVICLMPNYLDTVTMRSMYADVFPGNFTPLKYVSELLLSWGLRKSLPATGCKCFLITNNYNTQIVYK